MKAVLEFYADKPLESRRLKMCCEGQQAFASLSDIRKFCMKRLADHAATGKSVGVVHYQEMLECIDTVMLNNDVSLKTYDEVMQMLEGM